VQDFALIERYTVSQNIKLPLHYANVKKEIQREKVTTMLKQLGIEDKKDMLPTNISGGQRQRVAIARALINDAQIILADEPTGALDSKTSKEIMQLLLSIKEQGKTIIIVTHDQEIAKYCDRILNISDGKIDFRI